MKFLEKFELFCKNNKIIKENGEINIAEFSRKSGIPATTISSWYANGTENIKLSTINKLRTFTNLSLDYWIDDNIDSDNYIYIDNFIKNDDDNEDLDKILNNAFFSTTDGYKRGVDWLSDEDLMLIKNTINLVIEKNKYKSKDNNN